jgi:hypothetical protein
MDRRSFLRRTSLALAGGLVLGNEAMEMYERLTHKKVWAMGRMPGPLPTIQWNGLTQTWVEVWQNDRVLGRWPLPSVSGDDYLVLPTDTEFRII